MVAAKIDHGAHEPAFPGLWFPGEAGDIAGGTQKGLLHQVPGLLAIGGQASGQPVEPPGTAIKEGSQNFTVLTITHDGLPGREPWQRPFHTLNDAPDPSAVGGGRFFSGTPEHAFDPGSLRQGGIRRSPVEQGDFGQGHH